MMVQPVAEAAVQAQRKRVEAEIGGGGGGRGGTPVMHGRGHVTLDPRIATMAGAEHVGLFTNQEGIVLALKRGGGGQVWIQKSHALSKAG